MAKYTITHSCGHDQEHTLYGPHKDRERKMAWLTTTLCPDCYRSGVEAEREKMAKESAAVARKSGLPSLVGSEKQIQWAEQIRSNILLSPGQNADWVRSRAREVGKPGGPTQESSDQVQRILARIEGETNAGWWIDQRNVGNLVALIRQLAAMEGV